MSSRVFGGAFDLHVPHAAGKEGKDAKGKDGKGKGKDGKDPKGLAKGKGEGKDGKEGREKGKGKDDEGKGGKKGKGKGDGKGKGKKGEKGEKGKGRRRGGQNQKMGPISFFGFILVLFQNQRPNLNSDLLQVCSPYLQYIFSSLPISLITDAHQVSGMV